MMVLDLRSFDIVERVGFNELFILVTNPFPNPNSFRNPDSFENSDSFDILGSPTLVKNDSGTVSRGLISASMQHKFYATFYASSNYASASGVR